MTSGAAVLVVDDDSGVRDSLRAFLELAGFSVRDFKSAKQSPLGQRVACVYVVFLRGNPRMSLPAAVWEKEVTGK